MTQYLKTMASIEWYTPQYVFDALGTVFDLDPCSPPLEIHATPAKQHYVLPNNDGLTDSWQGLVWLNPPYGKGINLWMHKLANHNNGIALVPVTALSNKWFHEIENKLTAICFIKGRVNFKGMTNRNQAPHGSMLLAFGQMSKVILQNCNLGSVWTK